MEIPNVDPRHASRIPFQTVKLLRPVLSNRLTPTSFFLFVGVWNRCSVLRELFNTPHPPPPAAIDGFRIPNCISHLCHISTRRVVYLYYLVFITLFSFPLQLTSVRGKAVFLLSKYVYRSELPLVDESYSKKVMERICRLLNDSSPNVRHFAIQVCSMDQNDLVYGDV